MIDILILMVIVVVLSLAVYHVAQFSTKETPFEQALAEQRQKRDLDTVLSKDKSDKLHKKPKPVKKVKPRKDDAESHTSQSLKETSSHMSHQPSNTPGGKKVHHQEPNLKTIEVVHRETYPETSPAAADAKKDKKRKDSKAEADASNKKLEGTDKKLKLNQAPPQKDTMMLSSAVKTSLVAQPAASKGALLQADSKCSSLISNKGDLQQHALKATNKDLPHPSKASNKGDHPHPSKTSNKGDLPHPSTTSTKGDPSHPSKTTNKGDQPQSSKISSKGDLTQPLKTSNKGDLTQPAKNSNKADLAQPLKGAKPASVQSPVKGAATEADSPKSQAKESSKVGSAKTKEAVLYAGASKTQTKETTSPVIPTKHKEMALHTDAVTKNEINAMRTQAKEVLQRLSQHKSNMLSPVREEKYKVSEHSELVREQIEIIGSQMQMADKKKKKDKPAAASEKKGKINAFADDTLGHLLPVIHKSHLNGAEIQMLIDALLNKQQLTGNPGGEWVEKGRIDPIKEIKRQLEETESRLQEQTEAHKALSAKIIDLRSDLNSERSRSSQLKKQLELAETLTQQKLEAAASAHRENLSIKINDVRAALDKDFQAKLIQQTQAIKSEMELKVQQLRSNVVEVENQLQQSRTNCAESEQLKRQAEAALVDVQQQLQQTLQNRDELMQTYQQFQQHANALKEQLAQQDDSYTSSITEYKEQLARLTQKESSYSSRLAEYEERFIKQEGNYSARIVELQENLSASEKSYSQTMKQLSQSAAEREQFQKQVKSVETTRELLAQNQVKLKEALQEKSEVDSRLSNTENELSKLRELVKNQNAQIECLIEEKESIASQSVRPAAEGQENGDIHSEHKEQISNNNHLSAMYEEKVTSLTKEVSKLKDDLTYQRRKNDEDHDKWEVEAKHTREVLLRLFPNISSSETLDQAAFLKEVETAVAAQQKASAAEVKPQIIEKIVEKIVQDPTLVKELEDVKNDNADLYKKIELLNEEKLTLESKITSTDDQSRKIEALEIENKGLEGRLAHYQDVLSSTESLLKTLESSVESEEAGWREKIVQKDELICQLNADKTNLTLRLAELQSTLDKVKEAEEMESQLNTLKEKLDKEELEKTALKEELQKAQEELKSASVSQTAMNAYKVGSMGYMVAWLTNNNNNKIINYSGRGSFPSISNTTTIIPPSVPSLSSRFSTSCQGAAIYPSFNNLYNGIQALDTNGPTNGVDCQEDESNQADSSSLVSVSSASISESPSLLSNSEADDASKKKKKRKTEGEIN